MHQIGIIIAHFLNFENKSIHLFFQYEGVSM